MAERGFPHSNAATIRKNTFVLKWRAAERETVDGHDRWTLSPDYAEIFVQKVLTKGKSVIRVPVVDLAVILFRDEQFEDDADALALEERFRSRFPQNDSDYRAVFEYQEEPSSNLFGNVYAKEQTLQAISNALIPTDFHADDPDNPIEQLPKLDVEDPILSQIHELLSIGTSGVILTGPPGTGKSYYAHRIASSLATDPKADVFRVQFHPSYGYEDFVEGYKPDDNRQSGFSIVDKVFIQASARAKAIDSLVVLIIDEINRGDPARIFGELLTYLERSYRNIEFLLPFSGKAFSIPYNLFVVGTMNPFDRSVSHIDAAFVRRFDHIQVSPSREVLEELLGRSGDLSLAQIEIVGDWFDGIQGLFEIGLGHALFTDVTDLDTFKIVWRYRVHPTANALLDLNAASQESFRRSFEGMMGRLEGVPQSE